MTSGNSKPINVDKFTIGEKLRNGYNPMVEGVRWSEKYAIQMEYVWRRMPNWMGQFIIFITIFLLASGIQGDWIVILVHFYKYLELQKLTSENSTIESLKTEPSNANGSLLYYITAATIGSYIIYFSMGGVLHWYFYVRQRDRSHEWKCQPEKFPTPELARHEILFGSFCLFFVSVLTGCVSWYVANNGKYIKIYYQADEYGWTWFFLQVPIVFAFQDYLIYSMHRSFHTPFLYKHFHKLHHKYKQPTAFSVTTIHPVEMISLQLAYALPMILVPVHWILFYGILMYVYYHGIIDHSGIAFKAQWWQPWQPDVIFHDNHHQYFHVNYGFNMFLWDILHGTYRKKNRVYTEDIYYGRGKALNEVSAEELARDIAERKSENPNAYRRNSNENVLTEQDLKFE